MRRMMLLALAAVLMAGVTTVFAWPYVFPVEDDADQANPAERDDDDRPPPPPPPPHELERAIEDLDLNKVQQPKVDKIMKAHHDKMHKLQEKLHKELLTEMKSVLTEEQYKSFEKALKHRGPPRDGPPRDGPPREKGKDKDRPGKRPPPPPPDDEE